MSFRHSPQQPSTLWMFGPRELSWSTAKEAGCSWVGSADQQWWGKTRACPMAKWTVVLWDAPSQMGSHFQIFPELEGKCPLPEVNEVTNICDALPFFFFLNFFWVLFIYLFMAVLGLRFCARAFPSCGKRGPLFIAARGPLTIAASPVAEHRLQKRRLSNCGPRAQLLRGMWDPPRPGLEPMSPALAGRLSTTAPPGKPVMLFLMLSNLI